MTQGAPRFFAVGLQIWLHKGLLRIEEMAAEPPLSAAEAGSRPTVGRRAPDDVPGYESVGFVN
jgi:hypothetical protein